MVNGFPDKLISKKAFLKKYGLEKEYGESKLKWSDLAEIYDKYLKKIGIFSVEAQHVAGILETCTPFVNTAKYCPKDPEKLIGKIIRNCKDKERPYITQTNYVAKIHDLSRARALHLFLQEWPKIDSYIKDNFTVKGNRGIAKIPPSDPKIIRDFFSSFGCEIENHDKGYRSVHYLLEKVIEKKNVLVEVQVRTLYDEAWGEIDHRLHYPYYKKSVKKKEQDALSILEKYLIHLSTITGIANLISSIVYYLKEIEELNKKQRSRAIQDRITKLKGEAREYVAMFEQAIDSFHRNYQGVV